MYRNLKMTIGSYFISVTMIALLMLAVVSVYVINNNHKSTPAYPKWELSSTSTFTTDAVKLNALTTKIQATPIHTSEPVKKTQIAAVTPSQAVNIEAPKPIEVHKSAAASHTYKVTSYYLNVRSEPNSKSEIINVVKNGTELVVLTATDNGWLQLLSGGYVHGGYAVPVELETPTPAAVSSKDRHIISAGAAGSVLTVPVQPQIKHDPIPHQSKGDYTIESPIKPTTTVKSDSGLSAKHIALILKGTKLAGEGLEEVILKIEDDYGINAFFTIAVMKLESGNGKSRLANTKNNLFGLNATTGSENKKAFSFATKGDSIRKFGQLLAKNYVGKGFTTIEKVARKYCPANGRWPVDVRRIMNSDYRKLA